MRSVLFMCNVLITVCLSAQTDTIIPLMPVEITSQRVMRFAVGQSARQLDSAALSAFALRPLSDLLAQHTALDIRPYGTGLVTMSMRGGGSAHTAIVWNGINLQNPLSGGLDLALLPLGGISHVTVKQGGEAALFGGGAMSGLILLDNSTRPRQGWHGGMSVGGGSFGLWQAAGQLSAGNDRTAMQLHVSGSEAVNDFLFRNTAAFGRPVERQINARQQAWSALSTLWARTGPRSELKVHLWYQTADRQVPPTMTSANNNARQEDSNLRGVAEWTRAARLLTVRTRVAATDDYLVYNSTTVRDSRNRGQQYVAETEAEGQLLRRWYYRSGIHMTQNRASSNNYAGSKIRHRVAVFHAQQGTVAGLALGLNLRQEWVDGRPVPLCGSLGARRNLPLRITNRLRLTARASAGRNYNLPALHDLYWAGLGNPDLRAESGWSGEAGLDLQTAPVEGYTAKSSMAFSLTGYAMRLRDRIRWQPGNDGVWRPDNVFSSTAQGAEVAGQLVRRYAALRLEVNAAYQYTRSVDAAGVQLLYVPRHTGRAALQAALGHWQLEWRQSFNGSRPMTADGAQRTQPFVLSNTALGWQPPVRGRRLNLRLTCQNVFNIPYQVIQYYAMPGRNWLLHAGWQI